MPARLPPGMCAIQGRCTGRGLWGEARRLRSVPCAQPQPQPQPRHALILALKVHRGQRQRRARTRVVQRRHGLPFNQPDADAAGADHLHVCVHVPAKHLRHLRRAARQHQGTVLHVLVPHPHHPHLASLSLSLSLAVSLCLSVSLSLCLCLSFSLYVCVCVSLSLPPLRMQ